MAFNTDFYPQQVPCPGGTLYTVRAGDSIYTIAERYNTTVQAILAANPGINPNNLQIGQVLCIPGQTTICPGGILYTIRSGDTIYTIAQRYNTPVQAILGVNPGIDPNNLRIGQVICIPAQEPPTCPGGFLYRIQPGDTYYGLSQRYGLTVQDLITANPNVDPNNLQVGQEICIPRTPTPTRRVCAVALRPRPEGPVPNAGGVLWLNRRGLSARAREVDILIAGTGLPNPTTIGANRYTAVFAWGRTTYELPLLPVPGITGLWVGKTRESFPPEFFNGSVDIYPGPALGVLIENCR